MSEDLGDFVKELASDFTECPKCGCDEALILAMGLKENEGKMKIFCPACSQDEDEGKGYVVEDGKIIEEYDLEFVEPETAA